MKWLDSLPLFWQGLIAGLIGALISSLFNKEDEI